MGFTRETDHGTPPAIATGNSVTLTIDGQSVTLPEGTSIMRAASLLGGSIPKLCATDNVESFGSCRLCLVEVEGRNGYPASCTTPVAEGMVVRTQTDRLSIAVQQSLRGVELEAIEPVTWCQGSPRMCRDRQQHRHPAGRE